MPETVIRVENLGKKYAISHQLESLGNRSLREVITDGAKSFGRKWFSLPKALAMAPGSEEFWALQDVSFEVERGERIGIIGRNGAGKTTILKVLSRITDPSTGRISIAGRVASLLEVGTGFHPELSGRENIFLNGTILGMSKAEIQRKFDEIVDFAEIEKFLDTPVKRYSSGMYVRLAFAVAAHLQPEVLIVDEVLAVGDVKFQKKCLERMEDIGKEGRTVLFVSHQMSAIENLCSRVIVLKAGRIRFIGETRAAINFYLNDLEEETKNGSIDTLRRTGTGEIRLTGFSIEDNEGKELASVASGQDIALVFRYEVTTDRPLKDVSIGFSIQTHFGTTLTVFYSDYAGVTFSALPRTGKLKCLIRGFPYSNDRYLIGARITVNGIEADWPRGPIGAIDVEAGDFYKTGSIGLGGLGPILTRGEWKLESSEKSAG